MRRLMMSVRSSALLAAGVIYCLAGKAPAQAPISSAWRPPDGSARYETGNLESSRQAGAAEASTSPLTDRQSVATDPPQTNLEPVRTASQPARARVTKGSGTLPNDHGQVWREY